MTSDFGTAYHRAALDKAIASFLTIFPYEGIDAEIVETTLRELVLGDSFPGLNWEKASLKEAVNYLKKYSFSNFYVELTIIGHLHPTLEAHFSNERVADLLDTLANYCDIYLYEMIYHGQKLQHKMI